MIGALVLAAFQLAQPAPIPASAPIHPRAVELFDRDWVLMQWAKRTYDRDRDGIISVEEAQPAASAFREIADANGDGRITPFEYARAREFILARY